MKVMKNLILIDDHKMLRKEISAYFTEKKMKTNLNDLYAQNRILSPLWRCQ